MVKPYNFDGRAGCVQLRRARQTGTLVGLYYAAPAGLDDCDGELPWATVCEIDSIVVNHPNLRFARGHAAQPLGWCSDCRARQSSRAGDEEP